MTNNGKLTPEQLKELQYINISKQFLNKLIKNVSEYQTEQLKKDIKDPKQLLKHTRPFLWFAVKKYVDIYVNKILIKFFDKHPIIKDDFFSKKDPVKQNEAYAIILNHVRNQLHNEIINQCNSFMEDWKEPILKTPIEDGFDKDKILNNFIKNLKTLLLNRCKTMQLNIN